jgi:penicillin-binding protein 1C
MNPGAPQSAPLPRGLRHATPLRLARLGGAGIAALLSRRTAAAALLLLLLPLLLAGLCIGIGLALPKPELFPPGLSFSRTVLDRHGQLLFLSLSKDEKYRLPIQASELPAEVIQATLEMEDRRFLTHRGVDPRSMLRAAWGVLSRQRLGGGSTLTMQYARLRWGIPTRSAIGKLQQMARAIQLERHYSKSEILGAYFTCAPYGGNIEGIRAASLRWCGKSPAKLTLREAASLSVIPQSPAKRRPKPEGNPALASAQTRLMNRLRTVRGEPPEPLDAEFQLCPAPLPRHAPHFCLRQMREHPAAALQTSLDLPQQHALEQSIARFLSRSHALNLRNAAALLLHVPSNEIRAYVGSANFWDPTLSGQVDGVLARRSPGSSLKPFLYALALDAGLIHPRTLLDDAPARFAEYNPENSDREFLGPLSARDALRKSRNLPAIHLAQKLPDRGLEGFLRHAGVPLSRKDYGLAIAIGAAELSLQDLAQLYAGLARSELGISPAASWLTLEALRAREPLAPSGLAWKTGTSSGFRDAWATGICGDWVLCVWVGHFDGKPMPGLFARKTAAPLLWQTVTQLGLNAPPKPRPPSVTEVLVCSLSGDLAGPLCPHRSRDFFIPGASPITSCSVHREIFVDSEGRRVPAEHPGAKRRVAEFWSPQRLAQFQQAGLPRPKIPPTPPSLPSPTSAESSTQAPPAPGAPPRIVSPQPALRYVLRLQDPSQNTIPLDADTAPGVRQIFWFAGGRYLGTSEPTKPLLWRPSAGPWTIQAVDEEGRTARTHIQVGAAP